MRDRHMIHKCTNSKMKQVQLHLLAETALQEVSKHNSYTLSHSSEVGKKITFRQEIPLSPLYVMPINNTPWLVGISMTVFILASGDT